MKSSDLSFRRKVLGPSSCRGYRGHSEVGRGGWDHGLASLGCGPQCQNEAKAAEVGDSANSLQGLPGTGAFLVSGSQPPLFPAASGAKKKKIEFAQSAWGGVRGQASLRDPGLLAVNSRSKPLRGWLWWILTVHRYCFYRCKESTVNFQNLPAAKPHYGCVAATEL